MYQLGVFYNKDDKKEYKFHEVETIMEVCDQLTRVCWKIQEKKNLDYRQQGARPYKAIYYKDGQPLSIRTEKKFGKEYRYETKK